MTELALPKVDKKIIERKDEIVKNLSKISGSDNVLSHPDEIKPYETDALAAYTQTPLSVILPKDTNEVSEILKYCHKENIKVIPRGAGTGLSGGALPLQDAVILGLGKFNKILDIDYDNKCVVTQPGVTNLGVTHAVQHKGFYYAPDPSSQLACSIGGNVAENSGGVHSLKYGPSSPPHEGSVTLCARLSQNGWGAGPRPRKPAAQPAVSSFASTRYTRRARKRGNLRNDG